VPSGFGVLIVTAGSGQLAGQWGSLPLARGATVVVPFAAGAGRLDGNLAGIYSCPV
jgi:hypothetical protein